MDTGELGADYWFDPGWAFADGPTVGLGSGTAPEQVHLTWGANPKHEVTIGVVGKYIELQDAYKSVYESIAHAGIANTCRVNVRRIDAEDLEKKGGMRLLRVIG